MKNITLLLAGIFALLLISSCTIRKRTVNKGYFVQWNLDKKIKSPVLPAEPAGIQVEAGLTRQGGNLTFVAAEQALETEAVAADAKPGISIPETETIVARDDESGSNPANVTYKKSPLRHAAQKIKRKAPMPMDAELAINIGLLVLFLALAILFTILAINAGAGTMLYVWGILAVVSFIIFVTQVIDVIMG